MYAVYKWHRSAEEISIRTNGANRKASLTNGDFFTNGSIGEGFLTIGICLCILDMCDIFMLTFHVQENQEVIANMIDNDHM